MEPRIAKIMAGPPLVSKSDTKPIGMRSGHGDTRPMGAMTVSSAVASSVIGIGDSFEFTPAI